jgi:putative heme iron utilization protein
MRFGLGAGRRAWYRLPVNNEPDRPSPEDQSAHATRAPDSGDADPIAAAAPGILAHMNKDHADALLSYATALCGIKEASSSVMTAVDRDGFEMRVAVGEGYQDKRIAWTTPVTQASDVRRALIELLKVARKGSP